MLHEQARFVAQLSCGKVRGVIDPEFGPSEGCAHFPKPGPLIVIHRERTEKPSIEVCFHGDLTRWQRVLRREELLGNANGSFKIANDPLEIAAAVWHWAIAQALRNLAERAVERCLFQEVRLFLYGHGRVLSLLLEGAEVGDTTHGLKLVLHEQDAHCIHSDTFMCAKCG